MKLAKKGRPLPVRKALRSDTRAVKVTVTGKTAHARRAVSVSACLEAEMRWVARATRGAPAAAGPHQPSASRKRREQTEQSREHGVGGEQLLHGVPALGSRLDGLTMKEAVA